MTPRKLALNPHERQDLEQIRDHDPRPYLRERAAALLKVADGMAALQVARVGLLKPRHPETILLWLNDYEQTRHLRPRPATRRAFSPAGSGAGPDFGAVAPESPLVGRAPESVDATPVKRPLSLAARAE